MTDVPGETFNVDVTKAVNPKYDSVTFRLTTDAQDRLTFASREWRAGGAQPALKMLLVRQSPEDNEVVSDEAAASADTSQAMTFAAARQSRRSRGKSLYYWQSE